MVYTCPINGSYCVCVCVCYLVSKLERSHACLSMMNEGTSGVELGVCSDRFALDMFQKVLGCFPAEFYNAASLNP